MSECALERCICGGAENCNMRRPPRWQDEIRKDDALREKHLGGESILGEATRLTDRTRKDVYAHPTVNFDRIARLWSVILGVDVTPEQHALCMIAVKLSRLIESPGHRDSLVDVAGYARTIELLGEGG